MRTLIPDPAPTLPPEPGGAPGDVLGPPGLQCSRLLPGEIAPTEAIGGGAFGGVSPGNRGVLPPSVGASGWTSGGGMCIVGRGSNGPAGTSSRSAGCAS